VRVGEVGVAGVLMHHDAEVDHVLTSKGSRADLLDHVANAGSNVGKSSVGSLTEMP
jgi:hypothetical protein